MPTDVYVSTSSWLDPINLPRIKDTKRPSPILLDHLVVFDIDIRPFCLTRLEEARKATLAALGLAEVPAEGDDKYTEYGLKYSKIFTRMMDQAREAGTPKTGFETKVPGMAKGGRVGFRQGTPQKGLGSLTPQQEFYTDKLIRDNMEAIREDMSLYFDEDDRTEFQKFLDYLTKEDIYGTYNEKTLQFIINTLYEEIRCQLRIDKTDY